MSGMFELANGAHGFAYWQPTLLHTVTLGETDIVGGTDVAGTVSMWYTVSTLKSRSL